MAGKTTHAGNQRQYVNREDIEMDVLEEELKSSKDDAIEDCPQSVSDEGCSDDVVCL